MRNPTHTEPVDGQTQDDLNPSTHFLHLDDFTDIVAFHRKAELILRGQSTIPEKDSLKKCRFCS